MTARGLRRWAIALLCPGLGMALLALGGCHSTERDFRHHLARNESATHALETWCSERGIMVPASIQAVAVDDPAEERIATPAIRAALRIDADEPVRYRHVRLTCANTVLSEARNWYVPARLTPAMNETLDSTRIPFGKVVAPLDFHRKPLTGPAPAQCPAGTILEHDAVLSRPDGAPISLVNECYTAANIAPR